MKTLSAKLANVIENGARRDPGGQVRPRSSRRRPPATERPGPSND